jgi:hypothetical protein
MSKTHCALAGLRALGLIAPLTAQSEILAALNHESKAGQPNRREGVAIIDVDPASPTIDTIV